MDTIFILADFKFTHEDFKDEKSYLTLQNKFAAYDKGSIIGIDTYQEIVKKDFTIKYIDIAELISNNNTKPHVVSFYKNILIKLGDLSQNYIENIESLLERKNIFQKEQKTAFVDSEINKLHHIAKQINYFDFLPIDIREELLNQLLIIDEFLTDKYIPEINQENKLNFNLNRTSLIHLFYLLRKNNVIDSSYSNAELGKLIGRYFSYQDNISNEYLKLKMLLK